MYSINLTSNSHAPTNTNMVNRSQAVQTAVDAHATRLIQSNSPPEACVDSSLGPYVTSILREDLLSNNNDVTASSLYSLPEYDSLIELLESQCQMPPHVAKDVIADIALAVKTNGTPDCNVYNESNKVTDAQSTTDRRSRSKSLGAEPAQQYDGNFLGKILQETMSRQTSSLSSCNDADFGSKLTSALNQGIAPPQSLTNDEFHPSDVSFPSALSNGFASNGSAFLSRERQIRKQRVSFDETYATTSFESGPQCREPYRFGPAVSPSVSWYSPSSPTSGNGVDEAQTCLGASLGFLDLEDEEDEGNASNFAIDEKCVAIIDKRNRAVANNRGASSSNVINSELAQCHPVSGFPDLPTASNSPGNGNATSDKPPPIPRRSSKKQSSKKEAEDLVAALFFSNSRPRSNSLPLSVSTRVPSFSFTDKAIASSKSSASACTSVTSAATYATENDSTVIESTTEILLTMNYNLGHEAASLASQLSYGDLNLAQYLIEAARSITTGGNGFNNYHQRRKSRICRHELQGTCYRHDCPYSHDIAGVTCLFWLKGRCHHSDGSSCRFMHGFAESLLEGVNEDYLKEQQLKKEQDRVHQVQMEEEKRNQSVYVPTTNLLQHNEWATEKSRTSVSPVFGSSCWASPSVMNTYR